MKENPNLTDLIHEAANRLREQYLQRPPAERAQSQTYDLGALGVLWTASEPQLYTWADHVAWAELQREAVVHTVWRWIVDANDSGTADVDDLINVLNRMGATCPPEVEQNPGVPETCGCDRPYSCPGCDPDAVVPDEPASESPREVLLTMSGATVAYSREALDAALKRVTNAAVRAERKRLAEELREEAGRVPDGKSAHTLMWAAARVDPDMIV